MNTIEALKAAYLAGFNASGEGYNGEYPYGDRNQNPEDDAVWCKDRDNKLQAIKQEEQQPVPVKTYSGGKAWPVQTEWVGLTDDEAQQMRADCATTPPGLVDVRYGWAIHYARAIEAKLKEKNSKG